jgi:hypothetical protein
VKCTRPDSPHQRPQSKFENIFVHSNDVANEYLVQRRVYFMDHMKYVARYTKEDRLEALREVLQQMQDSGIKTCDTYINKRFSSLAAKPLQLPVTAKRLRPLVPLVERGYMSQFCEIVERCCGIRVRVQSVRSSLYCIHHTTSIV